MRRSRTTRHGTLGNAAVFSFSVAVLDEIYIQVPDPGSCLCQVLFQGEQFSHQRFEGAIFCSQSLQFVFLRHGCTVLGFSPLASP
jgi:hypothetical protein